MCVEQIKTCIVFFFFFSSRRRHTRYWRDWSSDVCSSDLVLVPRIMGGTVGVHPLWVLFATLAATALYGVIGAIFAVPLVAIVASTLRYLRSTLLFERWSKALVEPVAEGGETSTQTTPPPATSGLGPP